MRRSMQNEGRSRRETLSRALRTRLWASNDVSVPLIDLAGERKGHVLPLLELLPHKLDDDTAYKRNRSKKVELLSRIYDHCDKVFFKWFRLLTLGFSDGNSFIPINSCLLSSTDEDKRLCEAKTVDKRTSGYRQRRLAQSGAPVAMMEMIRQALNAGLRASYVLFDTWFSFPCHILALKESKLDVIARVKKTSKVFY